MMNIKQHPLPEALERFANGDVAGDQFDKIAAHLENCDSCLKIVSGTPHDGLQSRLQDAAQVPTQFDNASDSTPPPTSLQVDTPVLPMRRHATSQTSSADSLPRELKNHPKYDILRHLGSGGMGAVYLAKHRIMDRQVALKLIRSAYLENPRALERFQKEVRVVSRLSHPNIVAALDAEQVGDSHFLVMEYVKGTDLHQFVTESGPLSVLQTCHFAIQIAKGLQHADEQGLIHRDIKPKNLMLLEQNRIKVLDFGLATLREREEELDLDLTNQGAVLGTPDYISPEQATNAREVDIRADIYSLGCTLFFLLTGQPPYSFPSTAEKLGAHLHLPPPDPREIDENIPEALSDYLKRMMAKEPTDRPSTPSQVVGELGELFRTIKQQSKLRARNQPMMAPPLGIPTNASPTATSPIKEEPVAQDLAKRKRLRRRYGLAAIAACLALIVIAPLVWIATGGANGSFLPGLFGNRSSSELPLLVVVPFDSFWEPDLVQLSKELEKANIEFELASSRSGKATAHPTESTKGFAEIPQSIDDVDLAQYDGLIFVGAFPQDKTEFISGNPGGARASQLITEAIEQDKFVVGVCAGIAPLVSAGALNQRNSAYNQYMPNNLGEHPEVRWDYDATVVRASPAFRIFTASKDIHVAELVAEIVSERMATRTGKMSAN